MKRVIYKISAIAMIFIIVFALFGCGMKKSALDECASLLGVLCEDILDDDTYTTVEVYDGLKVINKQTDDIFGISGEIVIFLFPDDEYVNIVNWESIKDEPFSDADTEKFLFNMKRVYGNNPAQMEDGMYLWDTENFVVMLDTTKEDIAVMWINNDIE